LLDKVIKDCPDTTHFISKGDSGGSNSKNISFLAKNNFFNHKSNIVIYNHLKNEHKLTKLPPNEHLVVSYSTITTAIHLAAYMGAKNIILIGHDCGIIDGEPNFKGYHNDSTYKISWKQGKKDYINWLSNIEQHTITLKQLLAKQYNANVVSMNPFINLWLEGHTLKRK
jgi:hypothetical protein